MPVFSVITPVFNDAGWLPETMESVRRQSFTDWEHLLVDDGSTDGCVALIEHHAALDPRVRLIRMAANGGPGRARNVAVTSAQGKYIAFLDADDVWMPLKLEQSLYWMQKNNYVFGYHDYRQISHDGDRVGRLVRGPDRLDMRTLHTRRGTGCLSVVIERSGAQALRFAEDRTIPEDFSAWLSLIREGHIGHRYPGDLARYRLRKSSRSANKVWAAAAIWKMYRHMEGLPLPRALCWWAQYAWNSFLLRRIARPLHLRNTDFNDVKA